MSENKRPFGGPGGRGPGGGMHVGEKAKDFKNSIKKLGRVLGKYKFSIIFVVLFAAASAIFSIIGPKVLGNATTEIFNGLVSKISGGAGIDFGKIAEILLTLLCLYLASAVFHFIQGVIMGNISQKVSYGLRRDISIKIEKLPMSYFDKHTYGETLSRITNDIDTLTQSMNQSMSQVISSFCTLIGVLVMMFSISWSMTLLAVVLLPISLGLVMAIVKKSQKHFQAQQEYTGHINGHVEEAYGGHNVIKLFNNEQKSMETFNSLNKSLYSAAWKSQFLSGIMMPIMSLVGNLGYVGVSILGGILAMQGTITVGEIQSFIQYVRSFTQPINQIAQITNQLQSTAAAAERVFEFLEEQEEPASSLHPVSTKNVQGHVSFEHVHFGYSEDKIIINDFSADIPAGKKVAIVGPTGAGKTTMVKLLMRFYDVNSGRILVDGKDIRDYDRTELRRCFGMVLQDTWLFSGTIMENIRYGNLNATDEQVYEAARAARVDRFIRTLPGGYNMVLNEETGNVSQGQKQLLTIARAMVADPKILILDEATSSVDTRTEILIQQAMNNLMQGRTSFIIAHRLSTIRDADLILVMKDGDIIEQGTHQDLLKKNGFYAELYNSQFEQTA